MAKTVEIIGPSGSGKTAVYSRLRSLWKEEYTWVPFDDLHRLKHKMRQRYFRKALRIFFDMMPFGQQTGDKTETNAEWKFINYDNSIFLGDRYASFTSVLMDLVEEHCSEWYDGSDKRFVTIYMMMWSIAHYDKIISTKNDDRNCILKQGEGFVSRIMHLNSPTFDEYALRRYLSYIPMPDLLIFLDVSENEILERIRNRDRFSTLHKRMDDEAILAYTRQTIRYFKIAMETALERGVNVHQTDASKNLEKVTENIISLIS